MKVAVVGSGVSGLAATWLLNEHSDHEVHLYESDYRPGGHANTVHFLPKNKTWKQGVDVDTGFIVFNPSTYPNFLRFLKLYPPPAASSRRFSTTSHCESTLDNAAQSGIRILPTEMTFSVSRDNGAFEWAGKNLATIFCQVRRLVDPQMWRMIYDVMRFNACARRFLFERGDGAENMSIGEYLQREGYSDAFCDNYLIPMTAAIWSTPPDKCILDFPAKTLIQFMHNHHLLQVIGKPSWLTIEGGSIKYVNQIISKLPTNQLHLSKPVASIQSLRGIGAERDGWEVAKILLTTETGEQATYDHVIMACHSDSVLKILRAAGPCEGGICEEEERILGAFQWNHNEVVLHNDIKLMPKSRSAWSCWNYLTQSVVVDVAEDFEGYGKPKSTYRKKANIDCVSLTYGMNDLQHIPESHYGPVLVTLNPPFEPEPDHIVGRWRYDHPVLDGQAVRAQQEMPKIQNTRSISYAGAYLKYGFHEDGFTSGLLAACSIDNTDSTTEGVDYDTSSIDPNAPSDKRRSTTPITAVSTSTSTFVSVDPTLATPTAKRHVTVRPPFPIKHADNHLFVTFSTVDGLVAAVFDWLERSGTRELIGIIGAIFLGIIEFLLGINLDEHRVSANGRNPAEES